MIENIINVLLLVCNVNIRRPSIRGHGTQNVNIDIVRKYLESKRINYTSASLNLLIVKHNVLPVNTTTILITIRRA